MRSSPGLRSALKQVQRPLSHLYRVTTYFSVAYISTRFAFIQSNGGLETRRILVASWPRLRKKLYLATILGRLPATERPRAVLRQRTKPHCCPRVRGVLSSQSNFIEYSASHLDRRLEDRVFQWGPG